MPISDAKFRNAPAKDKSYRIQAGENTYLEVLPIPKRKPKHDKKPDAHARKVWRMRYRRPDTKKPAIFTIGNYSDISMVEALQAAQDAKALIRQGIDPTEHRDNEAQRVKDEIAAETRRQEQLTANSFENVARAWHKHRFEVLKKWKPEHADKILRMMNERVFKEIGITPITDLTAAQLLDVIQKVVIEGKIETAKKLNQHINGIYRYAVIRNIVQHNEAANLRDELPVMERQNNPYLTYDQLPEFINGIEQGDAGEIVKVGILFTMHTLARTAETRLAKWGEFDLGERVWNVPAERMKMNRPHIVPLSNQVLALLERLRAFTGQYEYLFVTRGWNKPMSANAMIYALYRLGYKGKLTIHGLRATGSTILNESGFRGDVVETALAHVEGNRIRGAYNHAQYLPERREMLQWYSEYLDSMKEGAKIIPIHRKQA